MYRLSCIIIVRGKDSRLYYSKKINFQAQKTNDIGYVPIKCPNSRRLQGII